MTGIERLRGFAKGCRLTGQKAYSNAIGDIADQIEREQDKVAKTDWDTVRKVSADMADRVFMSATIDELLRDWSRKLNNATDGHVVSDEREQGEHVSRMRVLSVISDMERHVLGHEGMEDSPVARWARELREALGGDERDHADERDAIAWVRDHGGLDYVMHEWQSRVPRDSYERRRQRLLDHIAECETALGRRNRRIEELGHRVNDLTTENAELRRRAMPEGCEWPRFEDGEPVRFGDVVSDGDETGRVYYVTFDTVSPVIIGFTDETPDQDPGTWLEVSVNDDGRVKRPAPKVTAGDGRPLVVGEFVWHKSGVVGGVVESVDAASLMHTVRYRSHRGEEYRDAARDLVHDFPDSWEMWLEDSKLHPSKYVDRYRVGRVGYEELDMNRDLVRRANALAERGQ